MVPDAVTITLITTAGVVLASLLTYVATRGKTKTDAKAEMDARIDARMDKVMQDAWVQIDDLKRKIDHMENRQKERDGAFARILRTIANQWPNAHGPELDPVDIALVEDTIPTGWIRRGKIT